MELNVAQIKELMDRLAEDQLGSLELESGSFRLVLRAKGEGTALPAAAAGVGHVQEPAQPVSEQAAATVLTQQEPSGQVIVSPIVGTFYAASGPDRAPFVQVGQRVESGDVVYIVESMKLMNEVTTPYSGVVTEIYVQNGQVVEYGQPIMRIE